MSSHAEQSLVFQSAWILSLGVKPGSVVHSGSVLKKIMRGWSDVCRSRGCFWRGRLYMAPD